MSNFNMPGSRPKKNTMKFRKSTAFCPVRRGGRTRRGERQDYYYIIINYININININY